MARTQSRLAIGRKVNRGLNRLSRPDLLGWIRKQFAAEAKETFFSKRAALIYLILFIPSLTIIVVSNAPWNLIVNDTLLLVSSFEALERFSSLFSSANSNPLQALFDIFPSGLGVDAIPNLIAHAVFGPGMNVEFFYIFCGLLLAFGIAFLARTVELSWAVATLAAILVPLLLLPTFGMFPLLDHIYLLWPILYYGAAGTVFAVALYWHIDGRSLKRDAAIAVIIALILIHLSIVKILFMTLMAPAMIACGCGALISSRSKAEFRSKLISAVMIFIALVATGIVHYLIALGHSSATHVFYPELSTFMQFGSPTWGAFITDISQVFINPFTYSYRGTASINGAIAPLAQLGALYLAFRGQSRLAKIFGRTIIVWTILTALTIAIVHYFYFYTLIAYKGPDPRHFIRILWPFYTICLAALVVAIANGAVTVVARYLPRAESCKRYLQHGLVVCLIFGPVAFIAGKNVLPLLKPGIEIKDHIFPTYLPTYTAKRNAIIDYLQDEVGIELDKEFRGSVVALPTEYHKDVRPYKAWRRETTFAYARAYLGNDLGAFSLRYFNIPTLDQMTHNVTPQYFLIARELLSRPGIDHFDRHFAMATRVNQSIMSLLGTRFIIADYELPVGTQRLAMPLIGEARRILENENLLKSPVRVYELPHPNIGNYSPTEIIVARHARHTISMLAAPEFDGRRTVVVHGHSIKGPLVPAEQAKMIVREGGVDLHASSNGESVLVLPVQFSNCWRIKSDGNVSLFRANLMQLGVRFSGELNAELRQVFGPFWRSSCRLKDVKEIKKLNLPDAVGAGELRPLTRGDGINLLPFSESLQDVVENSAIASIEANDAAAGAIQSYTMAPEGAWGEHYLVVRPPDLPPGPYTLSMQVRADSANLIALQLKDGKNNGSLGKFWLDRLHASVTPLGNAGILNVRISHFDENWLQLSLTANLRETKKPVIFIQILRNWLPFRTDLHFRAVKLERGEIDTIYQDHRP